MTDTAPAPSMTPVHEPHVPKVRLPDHLSAEFLSALPPEIVWCDFDPKIDARGGATGARVRSGRGIVIIRGASGSLANAGAPFLSWKGSGGIFARWPDGYPRPQLPEGWSYNDDPVPVPHSTEGYHALGYDQNGAKVRAIVPYLDNLIALASQPRAWSIATGR